MHWYNSSQSFSGPRSSTLLHCTHFTAFHCTAQHFISLHLTVQRCTSLHLTAQLSTSLHYSTLTLLYTTALLHSWLDCPRTLSSHLQLGQNSHHWMLQCKRCTKWHHCPLTQNWTVLHVFILDCTALHCTALHWTELNCTELNCKHFYTGGTDAWMPWKRCTPCRNLPGPRMYLVSTCPVHKYLISICPVPKYLVSTISKYSCKLR